MSFDVFLSYAGTDRPVAEEMARVLEAHGVSCWIAPRNVTPGEDWMESIIFAIQQCDVILLVFSAQTNRSPHVIREIERSIRYALFPVVCRIEDELPRGGYEYALSITHWFDCFDPLSPESLEKLCELVRIQLRRRRSWRAARPELSAAAAATTPADPFSDGKLRAVLLRLAEQMIEQRQVVIDAAAFSDQDRAQLDAGTTAGWLREQPSPLRPDTRFVTLASVDLCERVLAAWIAANIGDGADRIVRQAASFPPLADGLARHLVDSMDDKAVDRISEFMVLDSPLVERLMASVVARLARWPNDFQGLVEEMLIQGSAAAQRGVALGAQNLMREGRRDAAGQALDALQSILEACEEATRDRQFLVEIANEKGRLLLRQGLLPEAVAQLRQTLKQARETDDEILIGIVANNLARGLLDNSSGNDENMSEAIDLLEVNIERFGRLAEQRHLAVAYSNLGDAYSQGNPERAESLFRRDVEICRTLQDQPALVDALDRLGTFLTQRGSFETARQMHEEELELCGRFLDPRSHARALANLGWNYFRQGNRQGDRGAMQRAREILLESRQLFLSLDEPQLFASTLENLGRVQFLLGDHARGIDTLRDSIQQYRKWPKGEPIADQIQKELSDLEQ